MKMAKFIKQRHQGFSLIEAMVSIALLSIIGLGLAYATSRILLTQRFSTTQNLAVIQMREYMQTGKQEQVVIAGESVKIIDDIKPGIITISISNTEKNISMPIRSRTLEVSSTKLFSGDGKISLAY